MFHLFRKSIVGLCAGCLFFVGCSTTATNNTTSSAPKGKDSDGYRYLFNGKNLDGWTPMTKQGGDAVARQVFTISPSGTIHVYRQIPDRYQLDAGKNHTHGVVFTDESFDRYHLKFEYRWGKKICNNFGDFQYDAGVFYHVQNKKIWPWSIEYQIRYNHLKDLNHTGDIWNLGAKFATHQDADGRYRPESDGGKPIQDKGGEHLGLAGVTANALNGEWNHCEIIVMSDQYAIQKLNGQITNIITGMNLSSGNIGFQAETAEIEYRNIKIKTFDQNHAMADFSNHLTNKHHARYR